MNTGAQTPRQPTRTTNARRGHIMATRRPVAAFYGTATELLAWLRSWST